MTRSARPQSRTQSAHSESTSELAERLSRASVTRFWNVYDHIEWPAEVGRDQWFMPPELCSLYGTEGWESLGQDVRHALSFRELVNFFSLTLHGERPLVQGLCNQMYSRQNREITEYLHHFLDEENKHMVMFAAFCERYAGRVYPQKKLVVPRSYAAGEEDVSFFIKVLIVEELGDYFNVAIARDDRVHPLARELNTIHHRDEARHITFGKRLLADLFRNVAPKWPAETLPALREWLGNYLRGSWADFYNPSMYRDAGIPNAYELREAALASPVTAAFRRRVSRKLLDYFLETGILAEVPAL